MATNETFLAVNDEWPALSGRSPRALTKLIVITTMFACIAAGFGAMSLPPLKLIAILAQSVGFDIGVPVSQAEAQTFLYIRLPRVLLALLVGGGLAVSGAVLQGLFRNPLADPGLIGIASGAALAAVAVIVLDISWIDRWLPEFMPYALPLAAFCGAFSATRLVYRLANGPHGCSVATLLLAGIAVNAIASALIAVFIFIADDSQLRTLVFWNMGGLGEASWRTLAAVAPFILVSIVFLRRRAMALNAFMLGEAEAGHLGIDVEQTKRQLVFAVASAAGAGVALTGIIGFVGLIIPHLVRLWLGPDLRLLLPAAALSGGALLVIADLFARTLAAPAELPVGLLTSLIGGPFFLWLLLKQRRDGAL
jgi:iron complex transport system permease protein